MHDEAIAEGILTSNYIYGIFLQWNTKILQSLI